MKTKHLGPKVFKVQVISENLYYYPEWEIWNPTDWKTANNIYNRIVNNTPNEEGEFCWNEKGEFESHNILTKAAVKPPLFVVIRFNVETKILYEMSYDARSCFGIVKYKFIPSIRTEAINSLIGFY